jgi:biopolymer transport protein ExbD
VAALVKRKRRAFGGDSVNITSMMDMMTIILVFLLKSFTTEAVTVQASSDLQLPVSSALKLPKVAVNIVVTRANMLVDGELVLNLEEAPDPVTGQPSFRVPLAAKRDNKVMPLYEKLVQKAEQSKAIAATAAGDEFGFKGQVLLQCDKRLPYSVVRDVMFTAGQAHFGEFRFVVIKGS